MQAAKIGSQQSSKNYNAIDLMKFICAILIISIHQAPFSTYNTVLYIFTKDVLARIAVPFFFTTAGFFFFKKMDISKRGARPPEHNQKLKKYLIHLVKIYLLWTLIYLPLNTWLKSDNVIRFGLLFIRKLLFVGGYLHLWYLSALIFCIILMYFLFRYIRIEHISIIALGFYLIGLLDNAYFGIFGKLPLVSNFHEIYYNIFAKNGMIFGFVYVSIGALFSQRNTSMNSKTLLVLIIGSFALMTVESFLLIKYTSTEPEYYIMLLPTTIFIFLYLLNLNLADSEIFKILREMSLLIYLVHPLFIKALSSISKSVGLETYYSANSLVPFVCVTVCSVLFSYIVVKLSKRYSLLKAFY